MEDYIRAIETGIISGGIFSFLGPIVFLILSGNFSINSSQMVFSMSFSTITYGVILGVLYGIIFEYKYNKQPDISPISKSVVIIVLIWTGLFLIFIFVSLLLSSITIISNIFLTNLFRQLINLLIILVIYGTIFGVIYDRIKPSKYK